ncbi:toxin-antitoxin system HicB family antitoxin [Aeromonas caviae]|uniref:toxin-antitoxin system HicB family antitoxin n=1 Tax=Aeromonas TaxID=642 RepID=UPI00259E604A|nr:toxin-antitoxin system HicB family antitoxin [Aeromonas rivipollensis]MDM5083756.1 toxin-antitoxin system HicB family antitoxin [Aeromonas rivipollensis]MDM5096134.1 toxin-antitoxin system HicB family antitoxin [Aeromonas rivipollensis]MDM5104313.1 toxin-antitoxin system HicB family antitoxin [Aeromonas rivipollensis]
MINPEEYTVSVRMESVDGEKMYVARIQELPDVEEYADTAEFARELALDTIATMYDICQEKGLEFPSPSLKHIPEASGRITLRLARSLHAAAIQRAQQEGVSLNQLISNSISSTLSQKDSADAAREVFIEALQLESVALPRIADEHMGLSKGLGWELDSELRTFTPQGATIIPVLLSNSRSSLGLKTTEFTKINASVTRQTQVIKKRTIDAKLLFKRMTTYANHTEACV